MKLFFKAAALSGAALAGTMIAAAPASAQVNGIAINDPAFTIATADAVNTAYQQIGTQYATQLAQIRQLNTEISTLSQQLDTNGDGQLSDAEQNAARTSNAAVVQQIQAKNTQVEQVYMPVILAQHYAIEQVALQYRAALQQVTAAKNINIVLAPDATVWQGQGLDITNDVSAALNARVPTVAITPPANWGPQQQTQQIHNLRLQLMMRSAQAAQQQAQQPAQPATQPQGR